MTEPGTGAAEDPAVTLERLTSRFDDCLARLADTPAFAKHTAKSGVIDYGRRIMGLPGGPAVLYDRVAKMEEAGIFAGTDWDHPEILQAPLAPNTLRTADQSTATLECLSELRLLAVGLDDYFHPAISSEQARHFVSQVLALNLTFLFSAPSEADRVALGRLAKPVRNLYAFIAERTGYDNIIGSLITEIERILAQRPIMVDDVKAMVTQIAICMADASIDTAAAGRGADRLVSALFGPTAGCREDPGIQVYAERLETMDAHMLTQEANGFARAMHDTGLVSPYHPVFLRYVAYQRPDLVSAALGLSSTGRDGFLCYQQLVLRLIEDAVHVETAQSVYGLALMLERGILYAPAIGPALWRQIFLPLHPAVEQSIAATFGAARPARVFLLAGVLTVLGQPMGVGQGNNPTCQSARAISMWAFTDPDYLLQLIAWAARDNTLTMHFEGQPITSSELAQGLMAGPLLDVDAVSIALVPHLDRVYIEMGRHTAGRPGDPHRWINAEFHGWWVGRGCRLAIDVPTGMLEDFEGFVRQFYATYHPYHNGNQPVIHPQPAGIAVTDSAARFIGWHAIAIYRVGLDPSGGMRVYFYNPNNDGGQDWGDGVVVSTDGNGERFGESSLPIAQFASRLYLFHFDERERGWPETITAEEVQTVEDLARRSWAAAR
ncbi:hypothetical protein [Caenispirillum salinarum]|uniref:hypothetical protein n=1 Tax=Caenispirillum salinarum TaxID=859058 RepID=UPI0038513950